MLLGTMSKSQAVCQLYKTWILGECHQNYAENHSTVPALLCQ